MKGVGCITATLQKGAQIELLLVVSLSYHVLFVSTDLRPIAETTSESVIQTIRILRRRRGGKRFVTAPPAGRWFVGLKPEPMRNRNLRKRPIFGVVLGHRKMQHEPRIHLNILDLVVSEDRHQFAIGAIPLVYII